MTSVAQRLGNIDRRIIYALVTLALAVPLLAKWSIAPARMKSAEKLFETVDSLAADNGKAVFMSLDFGPNSMAENLPQAEVVLEHLFRKHIHVLLYSQYSLAETFLENIPAAVAERLHKQLPESTWEYGKDWVNLGFRPNGVIMIQSLASSDNWPQLLKKDARGNRLAELPLMQSVHSLQDIEMLVQLTSLVGTLDSFLQFFQKGEIRPKFVHGCTSITIPQAFIYLDSGQLAGLLEGVAGAAWYSQLLSRNFPDRSVDTALILNTSLGVAHLLIIALVVVGNIAAVAGQMSKSGAQHES